jgi:serine/threonine protein kinase
MTDPARAGDETQGTDVASSGELDVTMQRPSGGTTPLAPGYNPLEPQFAPPSQPGDLGTLGRYRVLSKVGKGGMGAVYLAEDGTLGRKVALKVMLPQHAADPESRARFLREARAAAMVHSDHVVTLFDVGEIGGVAYLAMEYLRGQPLDQYLSARGEVALAQVYRIGREVAEGLAAAHDLGLIHRDIKPGNIWLEAPHGRVKILDFGLARAKDDDTNLTTSGLVVGTPAYMSPEQARGHKLDGRSDLFSLGVMLYRLATGKMPFDGDTTMALLTSLAVDEPTPARKVKPDLPRPLAEVIHRLLAKKVDARFATAAEVAEALRAAEETPSVEGESSVIDNSVPMAIPVQSGDVWESLGAPTRPLTSGTDFVPPSPKRRRPLAPLLIGGAVAVNLIVIAAVAVTLLVRPAKGTLVIESADPTAELRILRDGEEVRERTRDREIRLEPGRYSARLVDGLPGNRLTPDEFEVTSRGTTRVTISVDQAKPGTIQIGTNADRRGATFALEAGGAVRLNGGDEIRDLAKLPAGEFTLTWADVTERPTVTNDTMNNFRACRGLTGLRLSGTAVRDDGLIVLRDMTNLSVLELANTGVTDLGMSHLRSAGVMTRLDLTNTVVTDEGLRQFLVANRVTDLSLGATSITGAGLGYFRNCRNLTRLIAYRTAVGDSGLIPFDGITGLVELDLGDTAATDTGLASFRNCKKLELLSLPNLTTDAGAERFTDLTTLRRLRVSNTKISNAVLMKFAANKGLTTLWADGSKLTDAGLRAFLACENLTEVSVVRTEVTPEAVREFAAARPQCRINWNRGTVHPGPVQK